MGLAFGYDYHLLSNRQLTFGVAQRVSKVVKRFGARREVGGVVK